jgi:hypothetical protein
MGAALTYARRYALFALVGIAGEDDLDAPDAVELAEAKEVPPPSMGKTIKGVAVRLPALSADLSKQLLEKLLAEIGVLKNSEELALWAHRHIAAKNTLRADDARILETAYQTIVDGFYASEPTNPTPPVAGEAESHVAGSTVGDSPVVDARAVVPRAKQVRHRNKAHLRFVAAQPCAVCQSTPCDAHHLKFAQPNAMGLKVSDEFTVPLCREHHTELHRGGSEIAWWANLQIVPAEIARSLWQTGPAHREPTPA